MTEFQALLYHIILDILLKGLPPPSTKESNTPSGARRYANAIAIAVSRAARRCEVRG